MKVLWSFEDKAKLEKFTSILKDHEITFEVGTESREHKASQLTVLVDDYEFENAWKLLMRHKKRKSSK